MTMDLIVVTAVAVASSMSAPQGPGPDDNLRVGENVVNSLFGPNGLIVVPTARTVAAGNVSFGAGFTGGMRGPTVNYGVSNGISVGGAFMDRDGADDKPIANAHIHIVPSNFSSFELGIGVIDAFDAIDQTFYAVGSAYLPIPGAVEGDVRNLRVHAGVGTGLFSEKLFGGAEFMVDNRWSLIGEWDTKNFNAALRYAHDRNFTLQGGWARNSLFLGANYVLRF
jgi:hypothetical protein